MIGCWARYSEAVLMPAMIAGRSRIVTPEKDESRSEHAILVAHFVVVRELRFSISYSQSST
jgi:hypothetical protein